MAGRLAWLVLLDSRHLHPCHCVPALVSALPWCLPCPALQAASARTGGEKDARLQYLSWRIWHMKRTHARVQRERRAAEQLEEESVITEAISGGYSSDEEAEPKTPSEPVSGTPAAASPRGTASAEARGKTEVTDVAPLAGGAAAAAAAGEAVALPGGEALGKKPPLQIKIGGPHDVAVGKGGAGSRRCHGGVGQQRVSVNLGQAWQTHTCFLLVLWVGGGVGTEYQIGRAELYETAQNAAALAAADGLPRCWQTTAVTASSNIALMGMPRCLEPEDPGLSPC